MSKSRPPRIKSKPIKTSHLWLYNGEGEALRMHLLIMERRNKANMFFLNRLPTHILGSETCLGVQAAGPRFTVSL